MRLTEPYGTGKMFPFLCPLESMRTIYSTIIMIAAAVIGFFIGITVNQPMGGAALLATITGFACTIPAIESKKL